MGSTDAFAHPLGFRAADSSKHPGDEATVAGGDVPDARLHGFDADATGLYELEEVLKFARRSVQPLRRPGDDHVDAAGADVLKESLGLRPRLAGVRGNVVVHVLVARRPSSPFHQRSAVLELTGHAKSFAASVSADPGVESSSHAPTLVDSR